MDGKLIPAWLDEKTHHEFTLFKTKHKYRSARQTVKYLLRFHKLVEKEDKSLFDKINFNLN